MRRAHRRTHLVIWLLLGPLTLFLLWEAIEHRAPAPLSAAAAAPEGERMQDLGGGGDR